jgi:hypothetical protein
LEGKVDFDWQRIFELFKKPRVEKGIKIKFPKIDEKKIKEILVERHDFNIERIEKQLEKLKEGRGKSSQQKLF